MVYQDEPQGVHGTGMVTGLFQLGECVPDRADQLSGVGSIGQPRCGPGGQLQRHGELPQLCR